MLNRHLSRSIVLQTLFEWDFRKEDVTKIFDILDYNLKEFAIMSKGNSFAKSLIEGILKEKENLDDIIQQAAPQWPIEKISVVDRNILRIGIYELLFSDKQEVPPKVAINEAIELAKAFGGENSGKFVSGVLGTIYKELGEPRKYETTKNNSNKGSEKKVDDQDLPVQELGGAIIYTKKENKIFLVFVHNIFGFWTLVKGSKEKGETIEECVKREIKEETGLDAIIGEKLDTNEYIATLYDEDKTKEGGTLTKRKVTYFLAKADFEILELEENGGERGTLDDVRWFELSKIGEIKTYEDLKLIINKGIELIKNKKND